MIINLYKSRSIYCRNTVAFPRDITIGDLLN